MSSLRRLCILGIVVALCNGCAPNTYTVRRDEFAAAHTSGDVIGAVYGRCRESAVRVDRLNDETLTPSPWPDYVSVREQTSRAKSFGVSIGSVVVGIGLASIGALMINQRRDSNDPSRLFLGRATSTIGVISIAGGVALTSFGIATGAHGARLGAEIPRYWEPAMTAEVPCVVDQRIAAVQRARERAPREAAPPNDVDPKPHPAHERPLVRPTPEPPLEGTHEANTETTAPDVR